MGDDPKWLGDLVPVALNPIAEPIRHELLRVGERDAIPHHVRQAVYLRDRGRCELCADGQHVRGPWHLDHIKPWSAGGDDTTANLRVLCEEHNQRRSNFVDAHERRRRPATWWCIHCHTAATEPVRRTYVPWECPLHFGDCTLERELRRSMDDLESLEDFHTWHDRPLLDPDAVDLVPAFCVHCLLPALTGYPL